MTANSVAAPGDVDSIAPAFLLPNYSRTYVLLQVTKEERRVGARGHAALIQRDEEELEPVCLIRAADSLAWRGGRVNGLALPRRDCLRPS